MTRRGKDFLGTIKEEKGEKTKCLSSKKENEIKDDKCVILLDGERMFVRAGLRIFSSVCQRYDSSERMKDKQAAMK